MDLSPRREDVLSEDRSWLASLHGTDDCQGATLDGDLFGDFDDGIVPSGVVLGRVDASGLYGPYDDAAVDGREVARGHLFTTLSGVEAGRTVTGAILYRGRVFRNRLPTGAGLDAAGEADLDLIRYE